VVTLGAAGAAYADPSGGGEVPALTAAAIDTTGAGDALLGRLAVELARGYGIRRRGLVVDWLGVHRVSAGGRER
jgi:ribokinase